MNIDTLANVKTDETNDENTKGNYTKNENTKVDNIKDENIKSVLELDSGIKFFIAIILSIIPFILQSQMSFIVLSTYLILVTALSRIRLRTLLNSIAAYSVIVLLPYFFGFLISLLAFWLTGNAMFAYHQQMNEIALRMYQLFLLWYIGSLYFNSTPIRSVVGLFDKLLYPLKVIGVPIADYLKVVMCVVEELKAMAPEVKKSFTEGMRSMKGEKKSFFKINIKGVSSIIVSYIVNSFQRLDKIEEYIKNVESEDMYNYKFKMSWSDVLFITSFSIVMVIIAMFEV